jgi:hypothetical protein
MTEQIIILGIGFILTSVIGGLLGYYFQNRSWRYQNTEKLAETERRTATAVYEEISKILDKRLYRMAQLHWKLQDPATEHEILEKHMNNYRDVLYEWNDMLNRNLALTQAYFGNEIRTILENTIFEEFKRIGRSLEATYIQKRKNSTIVSSEQADKDLVKLSHNVYSLNLKMIELVQNGKVGVFNPDHAKRK